MFIQRTRTYRNKESYVFWFQVEQFYFMQIKDCDLLENVHKQTIDDMQVGGLATQSQSIASLSFQNHKFMEKT